MADRVDEPEFEPLRLAPRAKRLTVLLVGPVVWLLALIVVALTLHRTNAIEAGLLIAAGSFAFAFIALGWLHWLRHREETGE